MDWDKNDLLTINEDKKKVQVWQVSIKYLGAKSRTRCYCLTNSVYPDISFEEIGDLIEPLSRGVSLHLTLQ